MRKNRLTIWFLSGFLIYGTLSFIFGFAASAGGALAFGGLCYICALGCTVRLLMSKYNL